jgi:hypothetical protein
MLSRSEWVLFSFLEQYLKRLEGPVAVQVWPRVMQLAKDVSVTAREAKVQAYATLRYVGCTLRVVSVLTCSFQLSVGAGRACSPSRWPRRPATTTRVPGMLRKVSASSFLTGCSGHIHPALGRHHLHCGQSGPERMGPAQGDALGRRP